MIEKLSLRWTVCHSLSICAAALLSFTRRVRKVSMHPLKLEPDTVPLRLPGKGYMECI